MTLNLENNNIMKRNMISRFLIAFTIGGLLSACSATSSDDKSKQLESLKTQQAEIAKQIAALEKEMPADTTVKVKAKEVGVSEVVARKFDHYVQTQGLVDSENNVVVSSKTPGLVTKVYVQEGQAVSKGQVLAQLDNAMILRNIEGLRAQVELANSVFERQQNLWNQKIGTEVQYLQAKANKENLEKQLASLEEQNDMTRIKAPLTGTVDEVHAKEGEMASPQVPAFRVVNAANLKLTAKVSEAYVTNIKKGNKTIVTIPELNKDVQATVTFVGKTIDPLSRTFNVEVKLPSFENLRPNMTGVVKVVYFTEPNAITVPVNVVQTLNNEKVVFVAEQNGKNLIARKHVVTVDGVFDNLAQIKSGIQAGDKVITFGFQGLSDGEVIKI
ncbi:MAG TPA: efflux RND transporter periplasmic adaptor subunit [Cyclobacteriaceae bacterium]|nr:efflux RND transporter periplasmic adaptor subunit [Cyclobacteriaceae bacterium]